MGESIIFYGLATFVGICSIMVVCSRNPVTSVIFLVFDLFFLAGIYASMEAHFVALIQILVYAGAITVLFVFVIMLLDLKPEALRGIKFSVPELFILCVTIIGFLGFGIAVSNADIVVSEGPLSPGAVELLQGNTHSVAMVLFTKYLWPFELASILILLAIVASVVITKKQKPLAEGEA